MDSAIVPRSETTEPVYARLVSRVTALYIDSIVMVVVIVVVLLIAVSLEADGVSRGLGFSVAGFWALHEPLFRAPTDITASTAPPFTFWKRLGNEAVISVGTLISLTGGTIGHRRVNLRVVDDRTRGNVSFPKAVARTVVKGVLGWDGCHVSRCS